METVRKTVQISCLTYFLYGLFSWIDLGVFIPPFPLRSLLFLLFLFLVAREVKGQIKQKTFLLLTWIFFFILSDQSFIELLGSYNATQFYVEKLQRIFLVLSGVVFAIFFYRFWLQQFSKTYQFIGILMLLVGIGFLLGNVSPVTLDWGLFTIIISHFLYESFFSKNELSKEQNIAKIITSGMAVIIGIDRFVFLFS